MRCVAPTGVYSREGDGYSSTGRRAFGLAVWHYHFVERLGTGTPLFAGDWLVRRLAYVLLPSFTWSTILYVRLYLLASLVAG